MEETGSEEEDWNFLNEALIINNMLIHNRKARKFIALSSTNSSYTNFFTA